MQIPLFYRTAAGVQSTATDLANWIIALKSGKLLKDPASIDLMWKPAILANGKIGGFNRLTNGYALGWPTVTREEHPAVGPVGGGRSALFVYLKDDLSIVVLSNLMQGNPDQFIDEIAGYYIPEMKKSNGFGLPKSLKQLRSELLKRGFKQAVPIAAELKKRDVSFSLSENELNGWGYELLAQNNADAAVSIMKLMVSMYPSSGNAYDSLAEIQEASGQHTDALVSYQQSLRLDPKNKHAAGRILVLTK
jgi:tetratricopeptide (TPR) repeat protein